MLFRLSGEGLSRTEARRQFPTKTNPHNRYGSEMPGGALRMLTAYASQNVQLSGQPDFTFFYKIFRKYSHFGQENITWIMDGPDQLFYDKPIQINSTIKRQGDLLSDLYFTFTLPDIYSKYTGTRPTQYEFQWVRFIGAQIIQNAAFFIGGQKIQEFDSDYMIAHSFADFDQDKFEKWRVLVGDIYELTDSSKGIYGGGSSGAGYPSVYPSYDNSGNLISPQLNRPSIFGRDISVPLPFWFSEAFCNALPLIGLQYQECQIQLTLRPINSLYTILDQNGYRLAPGYQVDMSGSNLSGNLPSYIAAVDENGNPIGNFSQFLVDVGYSVPVINSWPLNPRLQGTYVDLTLSDQSKFASTPLSYFMKQIQQYPNPALSGGTTTIDLQTSGPISRILLVPRRSDTMFYRNDVANWTNWHNFPQAPFAPTPGQSPVVNTLFSSGLLQPNTQPDVVQQITVLLAGNNVQDTKDTAYFTQITPWKNLHGSHSAQRFLPVISFSLENSVTQPSGSLNTAGSRNFSVNLACWPLPQGNNYLYDVSVYVECYNWLIVKSGTGGLMWAT